MVDHVEFETPSIVDNFISAWRKSAKQRVGYLYGSYKPYKEIPLGLKIVVSAIYEPPQKSTHDSVTLTPLLTQPLFLELGLVCVGVIYTDLVANKLADGSGGGGAICKRHVNSYFLSSAECITAAQYQLASPYKTPHALHGTFGSRFVTCVVSGNSKEELDMAVYQVSNDACAMVRDGLIEARYFND